MTVAGSRAPTGHGPDTNPGDDRPPTRESTDLLGNGGAWLSDCGTWRYLLWRRWTRGPYVLFVMLNPSTADAYSDDQTIRRCKGFARRWGAGGIEVVNLYPYRATDPGELERVGPLALGDPEAAVDRNDQAIRDAAAGADRIICALGAHIGPYPTQPTRVLDMLTASARPIHALALTKNGQPRHPSRLPYGGELVTWPVVGDRQHG